MIRKNAFITPLVFIMSLLMSLHSHGQTKQTTGSRILAKLNASAQMAREQWIFSFSKDHCLFSKQKRFKEQDGTLTSSFSISIPLGLVSIEPELKSYDSFFHCTDRTACITRTWFNPDGTVLESRETDTASLFLRNAGVSSEVYALFSTLKTLCDRSHYPGPAGIRWGDSRESAAPVLSTRFYFKGENASHNGALLYQTYLSDFAGHGTETIRVGFVDNKFFELLVIPKIENGEPITKTWYDVVMTVIQKYGAPNSIGLPQSVNDLNEITQEQFYNDFNVFDLEIQEGHWHPSAVWNYQNNVTIRVDVLPAVIGWEVHWQFLHSELQKLAEIRVSENPVDDF